MISFMPRNWNYLFLKRLLKTACYLLAMNMGSATAFAACLDVHVEYLQRYQFKDVSSDLRPNEHGRSRNIESTKKDADQFCITENGITSISGERTYPYGQDVNIKPYESKSGSGYANDSFIASAVKNGDNYQLDLKLHTTYTENKEMFSLMTYSWSFFYDGKECRILDYKYSTAGRTTPTGRPDATTKLGFFSGALTVKVLSSSCVVR